MRQDTASVSVLEPVNGRYIGGLAQAVRILILIALCAMLSLFAASNAFAQFTEDDFLDPEKAFVLSVATTADGVDVHFRIAPDYYMYRERFEFSVAPQAHAGLLGVPVYPNGIVKYDETFAKDLEVYYGQVTVRLPLRPGAAEPLTLAVTSQGCADAGLCYPPMTKEITLLPTSTGYAAQGPLAAASVPAPISQAALSRPLKGAGVDTPASTTALGDVLRLGDTGFADYLSQAGWWQIMLVCLLLGALLSFTPCVLPMVPILLAVIAGKPGAQVSKARGLSLAASFVLGMSLVYTALGVAAGLVGASLAVWLQTPWVLTIFALILFALALAMFDMFTVQAPAALQTALHGYVAKLPGGKHGGVFIMGMVSALIVGPCVAAPLAGVLLFISQAGDIALGAGALFALAWGQGLLLLAVGASSGVLLPRAGAWMNGIKVFFGILLLATAWWLMQTVLPAAILMLGWAFLLFLSAIMLGLFDNAAMTVGKGLRRALGLILLAWGLALLIGVAMGSRDPFAPLAGLGAKTMPAATQAGDANTPVFIKVDSLQELERIVASADSPVLLDFYADWCVSCIEMERFTFSAPEVAQRMGRMVLVQADVTQNLPQHRDLLKRFRLFGPPGIIFFDAQGNELTDTRVVGFQNASRFAAVLDRVLAD